ncbi:MAG: ABC transporter ATP-binding protein [Longimicrobiales bacterium]|jgi:phospholipid/cholesterol/gamma-HCH transport system ATP-binding protein
MSIRMIDVHKAFGPKEVLKGFSLEIEDGKTTTVIGGSGSGKSVALKHIVALLRPDEGDVWVDEDNVSRLDQESVYRLRRNVGYVFQFAALFDSMTIAENVGLGLRRMDDFPSDAIPERVTECLRLVDLDGYQDRLPAQLSGGQKKRAGLARAIATKPKYILYDEPTTGLDPVTTAVIDELIIRMSEELGVTGVVISHDMKSAFRISDRVAMLYDGVIRAEGTPDEIQGSDDPIVRGFIEGRPELMGGSET